VREAQEFENLWLGFTRGLPVHCSKPAKAQEARLLGMELEGEFSEPPLQLISEARAGTGMP
jgi:hypothetical protein